MQSAKGPNVFCYLLLSVHFLPEISSEILNGGRVQLVVSTLPSPFPPGASQNDIESWSWSFLGRSCMYVRVCSIYIHQSCHVPRCRLPPLEPVWSASILLEAGGELSLRFSSTVTLSIGSTGCNFSILLAEIPVSLWSSLPGPENDTDARAVFEVRNCRSSSAIIEQFELWSLARGAALFLLFLRYVQSPELLLVECFSKCWSACVRHVMLGLICVCFWVCVVRAGGPRIRRMSTSCQWIVGQQQCSCPASEKEQLSSQKLFGSCKWVLSTSVFLPKSDF